ncbi:MAG: hypothetical protein AB9903_16555 [Vulcanimicrobiota bacterium]
MNHKRKCRGMLLFTLGFIAFVFTLGTVLYGVIESSRMQIIRHKQRVAAQYCADAGLDYGRYMMKQRRWSGKNSYRSASPALGSSGWFTVVCERLPSGQFRLKSTGYATAAVHVEKTCDINGGE